MLVLYFVIYFVAEAVPALATGGSLTGLRAALIPPPAYGFGAIPYSLARTGAPESPCVCPAPALELAISPRSPGSLS